MILAKHITVSVRKPNDRSRIILTLIVKKLNKRKYKTIIAATDIKFVRTVKYI